MVAGLDVYNNKHLGIPFPLIDLHGTVGDGLDLRAAGMPAAIKLLPTPAQHTTMQLWALPYANKCPVIRRQAQWWDWMPTPLSQLCMEVPPAVLRHDPMLLLGLHRPAGVACSAACTPTGELGAGISTHPSDELPIMSKTQRPLHLTLHPHVKAAHALTPQPQFSKHPCQTP